MNQAAIELSGVQKGFGTHQVLAGVNLSVPLGKTYAFLGRNGAGKTTTIRTLMGLLKPDAGTVLMRGIDPMRDPLAIRRTVGYLAEDQQMWGWMKIDEILRFMAPFYPTWDWNLVKELADKFALGGKVKIRHLSKGQNVPPRPPAGFLAHLHPQLVILDDPGPGPRSRSCAGISARCRHPSAGAGLHGLFQFASPVRGRAGGRHHRHPRWRPDGLPVRNRNPARSGETAFHRSRRLARARHRREVEGVLDVCGRTALALAVVNEQAT